MSFYAYGGKLHSKKEVLKELNGGFVWVFDSERKRNQYVKEDSELNIIKPWNAIKFMYNFNVKYAKKYMDDRFQKVADLCEVTHVESIYEYIMAKEFDYDIHIVGELEPWF